MLEKEQFDKWLTRLARLSDPDAERLQILADLDRQIPRTTRFREPPSARCPRRASAMLGEKAATAIADFIVVDMFANYCTGAKDAKTAAAEAERQLKRIYR